MNKGVLANNSRKSSELLEKMKDNLDKNMKFIHFGLSFLPKLPDEAIFATWKSREGIFRKRLHLLYKTSSSFPENLVVRRLSALTVNR